MGALRRRPTETEFSGADSSERTGEREAVEPEEKVAVVEYRDDRHLRLPPRVLIHFFRDRYRHCR